ALRTGLTDVQTRQKILLARTQVQTYDVPDNVDLVDLCNLLVQFNASAAIAQACRAVISAVDNNYVLANAVKAGEVKNSHGVAIYFPTLTVSPLYPRLDFSKQTGWDRFLNDYLTAVRHR